VVTKKHGIIIATSTEARQAKPSLTVLALLAIPLEAKMERSSKSLSLTDG
jgi:hypothetical protein